jgi:hypothetical protein
MSSSSVALDLTGLGVFPLCANQERSLLAQAVARDVSPDVPPSLIRFGFTLNGVVDVAAVGAALNRFVERHPALRSSFTENILLSREERYQRVALFKRTGVIDPGVFVQQVHHDVVPDVSTPDWTGMTPAEQDEALLRTIRSEDLRPFHHSDRSRVRALFIRTATDQALLILIFDHVVFDGHSGLITCREMEHLLSGRSDGERQSSAAAIQAFPSFAKWQNQALRTSYFRSSISFWRDQWARFARYRVAYEDLPFSRPPARQTDHAFATEHATLNEPEWADVKAFAGREKVTPFAICLAALARVLCEFSGRSSTAVWSHLLNRVQPGTLNSIGFFANTHILGIELTPGATRRELVHHVGGVIAAALVHQELPLQSLWRTLKCVPAFWDTRVLLDFRTLVPRSPLSESLRVRVDRLALPEPTTPRLSTLGIYVTDNGHRLELSATFWRARFSLSGITDLLNKLRVAILDLVTDPDAPCQRRSTAGPARQYGMEEFLLLDSTRLPFHDASSNPDGIAHRAAVALG